MTEATYPEASPVPEINKITTSDIFAVLRKGLADFKAAPSFGLFFSAFYVLFGAIILLELEVLDQSYWIIPVALGFPLLAPFLAVGLYEVSHRLENGQPLEWGEILGVIFRQKDRQFPTMAMMMIMFYMFWVFVAHLVFALFMGLEPMSNILTDWRETLLAPRGLAMLAVGTAVGAVLSFTLFSLTVVSFPLLLDKELDFITAMICSVGVVRENLVPMLLWAAIVAGLTLLAMLPYFLGLPFVMPVLGHATWHLYRRTLRHPE